MVNQIASYRLVATCLLAVFGLIVAEVQAQAPSDKEWGSLDGVKEKQIELPGDSDYVAYLAQFENGDVLLKSSMQTEDEQRMDFLWRVDPDDAKCQLLEEWLSTPDLRIGYARAAISPGGTIAIHRTVETGHTTKDGMSVRGTPVHELLIWNMKTGERWTHPVVSCFAWLDDDHLAISADSNNGGESRVVGILDVTKREVATKIPVMGQIYQMHPMRAGAIALELRPDPENPQSYDEAYLARVRGEPVRTSPGEPATTSSESDEDQAVRPFNHPWVSFGKLVELDFSDLSNPTQRVLMDVSPNGGVLAVDATGERVVLRTDIAPGTLPENSVLYDTRTNKWRSLSRVLRRVSWRSNQKELVAYESSGNTRQLVSLEASSVSQP